MFSQNGQVSMSRADRLLLIVGARPTFMKVAPLMRAPVIQSVVEDGRVRLLEPFG